MERPNVYLLIYLDGFVSTYSYYRDHRPTSCVLAVRKLLAKAHLGHILEVEIGLSSTFDPLDIGPCSAQVQVNGRKGTELGRAKQDT